ncbi:hypothetical protein BU204_35800 [Actinophytocola xanthii]|uniref:EamA domain-containing protein n=1 Tax=Actinophytocola xanthii TaxID=1912961 RepID=A0A1Q8BY97_9PSEU|nr:DMT family transporter [Actinophytocola xanthii]OLF07078.1 hypothetical protein BU204_35800 [Actinophytocola xanthii]
MRVLPAGILLLLLRPALPTGIWWYRSLILGAVNFAGFFACQAVAVHHIPVGVAATIAATQTLLVPLGAVLLIASPVHRSHIGYAAVGIAGVALLVLRSDERLHLAGVCAAAGTAICNTLGLLLTRRWGQPRGAHHLTITGWQMIAGGAILSPAAALAEGLRPPTSGVPLSIVAVVVATTAAAFAALFGALHAGLAPTAVSRLMLLCPLAVTTAGWLLFEQSLSPLQILGAVLVIVPVLAACHPAPTRRPIGRHRASTPARRYGRHHDRRQRKPRLRSGLPAARSVALVRNSAQARGGPAATVIIILFSAPDTAVSGTAPTGTPPSTSPPFGESERGAPVLAGYACQRMFDRAPRTGVSARQ